MNEQIIVLDRSNIQRVAKRLPLLARAALKHLIGLKFGTLTVQWPAGEVIRIHGSEDGADARINLKSFDLPKRVLKSGDVGVGESFMDGQWSSPDVTAVLLLFCQNRGVMIARKRNFWSKLLHGFIHWRNRNTRSGSKRNISAHYDLGNSFYEKWLDPSMTYSSAYRLGEHNDLESAQNAKYQNLIDETEIRPNDHVLEIGCGWGGFAEYAAKTVGCRVTGLTISQEQYDFARKRIFEAGLNDKVDIVFRDYRDEVGTYDRIASIEMFEAVGEKFWPTYFDCLKNRLKPSGKAGIQVITIQEAFFDHYRSSTDFIQRYIFPGGMLPTPEILKGLGQSRGLEISGHSIFGQDYAQTLADWRRRFQAAWSDIEAMGFDDRFKRMWEFYLHYCEAGFLSRNIDVRQVIYSKS